MIISCRMYIVLCLKTSFTAINVVRQYCMILLSLKIILYSSGVSHRHFLFHYFFVGSWIRRFRLCPHSYPDSSRNYWFVALVVMKSYLYARYIICACILLTISVHFFVVKLVQLQSLCLSGIRIYGTEYPLHVFMIQGNCDVDSK